MPKKNDAASGTILLDIKRAELQVSCREGELSKNFDGEPYGFLTINVGSDQVVAVVSGDNLIRALVAAAARPV